jgi:uncharacterized membrane protein HdeD (DUF308 family)
MKPTSAPAFQRSVHRVIHVLIGLVFLFVAATFVFAPLTSYAAVGLFFGMAVLFTGILEILYAIFFRRSLAGWGWHLASGILDLVVGLYLNAYPMLSLTVIPMLAAFWLIWRGLTLCGYAASQRRASKDSTASTSRRSPRDYDPLHRSAYWEWGFGLGAILWGLVMLWWPAEGVLTVVYLLAVAFGWMGLWRLFYAFRK